MNLQSLEDLEKLSSVLDIEEVSERLIELVEILYKNKIPSVRGSEAISDLILRQGENDIGLSVEASEAVLGWIMNNYDSANRELIETQSGNLANLTCRDAKVYLEQCLASSTSEYEMEELKESLSEIRVRS